MIETRCENACGSQGAIRGTIAGLRCCPRCFQKLQGEQRRYRAQKERLQGERMFL